MERPVFEFLVGQPYNTVSPAFTAKLESFREAMADEKPVVVVMLDRPRNSKRAVFENTTPEIIVEQLQEYLPIKKRLDQVEILPLGTSELFGILSELGLQPIAEKLENQRVKKDGTGYVLFDKQGKALKVLPASIQRSTLTHYVKWLIKQT